MEEPAHFKDKSINAKVLNYYKSNEVQKFVYNKPFRKGPKDKDNEFAVSWSKCRFQISIELNLYANIAWLSEQWIFSEIILALAILRGIDLIQVANPFHWYLELVERALHLSHELQAARNIALVWD